MANYPAIISRKLKYNSPSGYVHIGKYIPPFEKVKEGFGFLGVIVEDWESGKLQCHTCGEWYEQMSQHLKKHHLTSKEYKIKYSLLLSTALKSKKMRLKQSAVMIKLRKENKSNRYKFKRNNEFAGNRKNKPKPLESRNKFGVCDLQIMQKVIELRDELHKTPTLIDLKERYGAGFIFQFTKRYDGYISYCKKIGLDCNFSNFNPKYSREYFIEKALSNEPVLRIFTTNEVRALYKYFSSIKELKKQVERLREVNK